MKESFDYRVRWCAGFVLVDCQVRRRREESVRSFKARRTLVLRLVKMSLKLDMIKGPNVLEKALVWEGRLCEVDLVQK